MFHPLVLMQPTMDYSDNNDGSFFSDEVQEEANSYFQQIYAPHGRMSISTFLIKLKQFRDSSLKKDKDLLSCIVKNLFDEFRFFHDYPDRELRTTAEVYGGLIRDNIVQNIQFATALRKVVDALQAEPASPLWNFGIIALNTCRSVLFRYPKVCQMIANIEAFNRFPSAVRDLVLCGIQGSSPSPNQLSLIPPTPINANSLPQLGSNFSNIKFVPPRVASTNSVLSATNRTNIDPLLKSAERSGFLITQPPQHITEKISFLCNNLSQANLIRKAHEVLEMIQDTGEEFMQWLAQYLVMTRIPLEMNFHTLYDSFLQLVNNENLDNYVRSETFRNVNVLLKNDKRVILANIGERQLLKNLGNWLGLITIARNRPILTKELDLKLMLFEAFYKGQSELLYVVPFVIKIISASSKSTIFGPRCAWISALVKVLVEIHNEPDLKLNLKFEIEILCKELNVDIHNVEVGNYLKDSNRTVFSHSLQQTNLVSDCATTSSSAFSVSPDNALLLYPYGETPPQPVPNFHYNDLNIYSPDGLSQHIEDPSYLPLFQQKPHLKVLCKTAIVNAIKELIGGITDRSINVALTVTEHICRKDFFLDSDIQHMRRAAHQMMRSMTAAMAAITCREPLSNAILNHLKQALYNHLGNSSTTKMIEEAAFAVTEANLEVATNFIVKSACEKAVSEIEKRLEADYLERKLALRKEETGPNPELITQINKIPEQLRIKFGPVSEDYLKVYDNYSTKICGFKPLSPQEMVVDFNRRSPPATPLLSSGMECRSGEKLPPARFPFGGLCGFPPAPAPTGPTTPQPQQLLEENSRTNASLNGEDEEAAFRVKVEAILREWISICYTPAAQIEPQHAFASISRMMQLNGVISSDELISKFFKHSAEVCFDICHRYLKNDSANQSAIVRQRCFYTLDAYSKLICVMVRYNDTNHHSTKVNLLKKFLGILTATIRKDHDSMKRDFNGLPYYRVLFYMFNELTTPDSMLVPIMLNIVESFGQAMFVVQPRLAPGYTFYWLELLGQRKFISRLLSEQFDPARSGAAIYTQLLLCHLKFLAPFLRNIQLSKTLSLVYRGTMRILLLLLHDFPEILCDYHYVLCDVVPNNCVQLRNLILSAYPKDMRLPDPFSQNLQKMEHLPELSQRPKLHREVSAIIPVDFRLRLDDYMDTRDSIGFLSDHMDQLRVGSCSYNTSLINAIVMYVGIRAIDSLQEKSQQISSDTIGDTSFMDIFHELTTNLCLEGRYLFLNAIANQLRYPNLHTHYFSCVLLYLFHHANIEMVQEQITRILFERLIALRPHPWGLLITFIELISNRQYDFWRHDFVRSSPEIERSYYLGFSMSVNSQLDVMSGNGECDVMIQKLISKSSSPMLKTSNNSPSRKNNSPSNGNEAFSERPKAEIY